MKNRINGLLFKPGDATELSNLIIEMIENEAIKNSLRANARKTVLERSWGSIFDGLVDTYEEVIFNNRCAGRKII